MSTTQFCYLRPTVPVPCQSNVSPVWEGGQGQGGCDIVPGTAARHPSSLHAQVPKSVTHVHTESLSPSEKESRQKSICSVALLIWHLC